MRNISNFQFRNLVSKLITNMPAKLYTTFQLLIETLKMSHPLFSLHNKMQWTFLTATNRLNPEGTAYRSLHQMRAMKHSSLKFCKRFRPFNIINWILLTRETVYRHHVYHHCKKTITTLEHHLNGHLPNEYRVSTVAPDFLLNFSQKNINWKQCRCPVNCLEWPTVLATNGKQSN